jgi:hypothetical protein
MEQNIIEVSFIFNDKRYDVNLSADSFESENSESLYLTTMEYIDDVSFTFFYHKEKEVVTAVSFSYEHYGEMISGYAHIVD